MSSAIAFGGAIYLGAAAFIVAAIVVSARVGVGPKDAKQNRHLEQKFNSCTKEVESFPEIKDRTCFFDVM